MESQKYRVLGLMSGTSLDGLDFALCTFEYSFGIWTFNLEKTNTKSYDSFWKEKLSNAHLLTSDQLFCLHKQYGKYLGEQCTAFLKKNACCVDFIASHGHTVFHQPEEGISVQIGDGCQAAISSNLPFVCDFRKKDLCLEGQGAPLVPIGDKLLFSDFTYCLNIGGIANISFPFQGKRVAYDICVANMGLNYLCNQIQLDYDENGAIASNSIVSHKLWNQLNALDYFNLPYPKSLGREWFQQNIIPILNQDRNSTQDQIATFTDHIAYQIAKQLNQNENDELLITGGGAHNKFLVSRIKYYSRNKIVVPSLDIIDFKEALVFAFLGVLRWRNENNCLSSVTGALRDNCGGVVFLP
ncbi:MAG: anhydro-N-acetylmuramic acid kinase [Bacteroidales bacterium]